MKYLGYRLRDWRVFFSKSLRLRE